MEGWQRWRGEEAVPDWGPPPREVGIENRSGQGDHEEEERLRGQPGNTGTFQTVGKQEVNPWVLAAWPGWLTCCLVLAEGWDLGIELAAGMEMGISAGKLGLALVRGAGASPMS